MDFCPRFWDWLVASNVAGGVASASLVGQELKTGHDQLAQWSAQRGNEFFIEPDTSGLLDWHRVLRPTDPMDFRAPIPQGTKQFLSYTYTRRLGA